MTTALEVCLCSFDSRTVLATAIESLAGTIARRSPHIAVSIAVQENSPDRTTLDLVAGLDSGLPARTVHAPDNPGFAAACNRLAAGSTADWLLFFNPDCVNHTWEVDLDALAPGTVWGPAYVDAPRPASHRGRTLTVADEMRRSWLRRYGVPPAGEGFVSGAALLVRRDDHDRIGGFDESYFMYYEDVDYCFRANRVGIATRLADGWSIQHSGGHAAGREFGTALRRSYESGRTFHARFGGRAGRFQLYVVCDAALRWLFHALRRDPVRRRGYAQLLGRAAGDLIGRRP